jgi:hypothetical protein
MILPEQPGPIADAPLMSFVGIGPLFHTPGDVPAAVTSPEALETVNAAIGDAVEIFMHERAD